MKKILFITLLAFSTPTMAANERLCAELSIRLTMFSMLARMTNSKEEYDSTLYKKLIEGDATKESQQILKSLIDLAWSARGQDVSKVSMDLYDQCVGPQGTKS